MHDLSLSIAFVLRSTFFAIVPFWKTSSSTIIFIHEPNPAFSWKGGKDKNTKTVKSNDDALLTSCGCSPRYASVCFLVWLNSEVFPFLSLSWLIYFFFYRSRLIFNCKAPWSWFRCFCCWWWHQQRMGPFLAMELSLCRIWQGNCAGEITRTSKGSFRRWFLVSNCGRCR